MRQHSPATRRKVLAITATTAVFAAALVGSSSAVAADRIKLFVVGTSDVSDSQLMSKVIEPGFEAAYPQWDLDYVGKATGAAIQLVKDGTAAAMVVHAASVENQFVADGYSQEPFGRAVFWGDYVLLGPADDPAGVLTSAPHDIVTAFEKVAAAGAAGTAHFVSRGGTAGTTIQEHAIWAMTNGIAQCTVTDANGGGGTPYTVAGACASSPNPANYPSWYHATGATQAPNVSNADSCPSGTYPGRGCYVFTDRGTFNYLQSTNALSTLKSVTRDNAASARGTNTVLVNSFHAYVVSPKNFANNPNAKINVVGATDFLNYLTSDAGQAAVGGYLNSTNDAPFIPAAAPKITASALPASVPADTAFTVTGTLTNVIPGTTVLSGKTVTLKAAPASTPLAAPVAVASGVTDSTGAFSISYTPASDLAYTLGTDSITQVEVPTLTPVFADILSPATKALSTVAVVKTKTTAKISSVKVSRKYSALITVKLSPKAIGSSNVVKLYGRNSDTKSKGLHLMKTVKVKPGQTSVSIRYTLANVKHKWKKRTVKLKVTYSGPVLVTSTSTTKTLKLR